MFSIISSICREREKREKGEASSGDQKSLNKKRKDRAKQKYMNVVNGWRGNNKRPKMEGKNCKTSSAELMQFHFGALLRNRAEVSNLDTNTCSSEQFR